MAHLDEHTIDLFIIEPEMLDIQRAEIEVHLAECAGCRILMEEFAEFYCEAETVCCHDLETASRGPFWLNSPVGRPSSLTFFDVQLRCLFEY
jgi:hypothetical protein